MRPGSIRGRVPVSIRALQTLLRALILNVAAADGPHTDFSGVWSMVQHSRPGAPFFIPVEPELSAEGKRVTAAFAAKYDVAHLEANAHCVEPGMPTVMWGIGGAAMEIVQRPKHRTVYQTLLGEASEYVSVRPLESFAEFDGPDPLDRALGVQKAEQLRNELGKCTESVHRSIENRQDEFYLDPGNAPALFASRYRAMPGKSGDYMRFVRAEMFPVMQRAKEEGTFSGLDVTVSGHGGESGLITLNMYYPDFAPLDGPPPIAKTLGPEGTREFLVKGAGLITPLEWIVRRRVVELSF